MEKCTLIEIGISKRRFCQGANGTWDLRILFFFHGSRRSLEALYQLSRICRTYRFCLWMSVHTCDHDPMHTWVPQHLHSIRDRHYTTDLDVPLMVCDLLRDSRPSDSFFPFQFPHDDSIHIRDIYHWEVLLPWIYIFSLYGNIPRS